MFFKKGTFKSAKQIFKHCFQILKSLAPQILLVFWHCTYIGLSFFSAAVLGVLSIKQPGMPWYVYGYAVLYFLTLAGLIAAEYKTKKNLKFFVYILLTTPINFSIAFIWQPQPILNFFSELFPQALIITACALAFYAADYEMQPHSKKRKE